MGRYLMATVLAVLALAGAGNAQKRSNVALVFTPPPETMKTGDVVETTLGFRALVDLDGLHVSAYPFNGVEVVSTPAEAMFGPIAKGESRTMTVRVRLTAPKFGSLTVSMEAQSADGPTTDAKAIVYGNPKR